MTQTIVRMYPTKEAATGAVKALTDAGFSLYDIHTVFPPDPVAHVAGHEGGHEAGHEGGEDVLAAQREAIAAAIERGRVTRGDARVYARGVQQGGSLVVVNAPFGTAREAIGLLKGHEPIDSGVADPETAPLQPWDDAAPLSSAMQWPVLSHNPAPFSEALGLPLLTKGRHSMSEAMGWRELSDTPAPLSEAVKLPVLTTEAAPFSRAIGAPTLSEKAAPLSDAVGVRVLTETGPDYKPVIPRTLLLDEAAPFSKWLGLPVLWRKRE